MLHYSYIFPELRADSSLRAFSIPQRCSWVPLYIVDFVSYKTYYWSITTDSDLDDYVTSASPDSSEAWLSQVTCPDMRGHA